MTSAALKIDTYSDFLLSKKEELNQKGYIFLEEDDLPLSQKDWQFVEDELNSVNFTPVESTEGGEEGRASIFRVKMSKITNVHLRGLWDFLNGSLFHGMIETLTDRKDLFIDRCQAHTYFKGGYIGRHADIAKYPDYKFSLVLFRTDDYEGGEINFYLESGETLSVTPKARSVVLFDSRIPHDVSAVVSGTRSTLCNFYSS